MKLVLNFGVSVVLSYKLIEVHDTNEKCNPEKREGEGCRNQKSVTDLVFL